MLLRIGRYDVMILVSACLAGYRCRYDGAVKPDPDVSALVKSGQALPVCPEQLGGLPCPRVPAERTPDGKRVLNKEGGDVTEAFRSGAEETLRIAKLYGCKHAILKAKSPSCGLNEIYDGTFSGTLRKGNGVTVDLLLKHGITVEGKD